MDDAAAKNRKASGAEGKKPVPRLENPGAMSFGRNGKPAAPALGDDPALYRPGEGQGRRPARHENHAPVQAARFSLAVESSGARSEAGGCGFRENPAIERAACRTRSMRGPPFPRP
jgi:hypothetical protein